MLVMENPEEVLQILERYTKLKPREIPQELEDYIRHVAKTGDTVYRWPNIKYLFREKLVNVIKQFHESTPTIDDLPQYPNVDPFNYETMKNGLLERLDTFNAAPFTIQRICELLSDPRKQYTRIDKFMRALEKNILVVSTIEPGRKTTDSENGDSLDSMVNGGDLPNEVDIDMPNTALPSINTLTPSAAVIMAEVAMAAKITTNNAAAKLSTPEDDVDLPQGLEAADIEPDVIADSIGKFEEAAGAEGGAISKEESPEEAASSCPLVVIKPLTEAEEEEEGEGETKENVDVSEETRETSPPPPVVVAEKEKESPASEEIKVDIMPEEVEKPENTTSNVGISSSSSSSEDSNSTDDNESLTEHLSDAEAVSTEEKISEPAPEVDQGEQQQQPVEKPSQEEESKTSDFSDEEKNTDVIDPVGTTEEEEEEEEEKLPQVEKCPESTTEEESSSPSDLAFHPTADSSSAAAAEEVLESRDRNEDGEPVCKKPMESDMLIEVPPALPLEVDEGLLAKIEESASAPPLPEVPPSASDSAADLMLPLEVADMEVAPAATSEVSAMATEEEDTSVPMKTTDDAMEVDESSMEPMDQ